MNNRTQQETTNTTPPTSISHDENARTNSDTSNADDTPILLSSYNGFNLVRYKGQVLGVPINLGPLNLREDKSRSLPGIFFADNEVSAKTIIDNPLTTENVYNGFNIAYFDTKYFAIPESSGIFNMVRFRANQYGKVIICHSLDEIKREIDMASLTQTTEQGLQQMERGLFISTMPPDKSLSIFNLLKDKYDLTVLALDEKYALQNEIKSIKFKYNKPGSNNILDMDTMPVNLREELISNKFDVVIVPYDNTHFWVDTQLEKLAINLTNRLLIVHPDGATRLYKGEEVHRVLYNKAYLNSMLRFVPKLTGKKILEVGCSDGLLCDMLLNTAPESIVGIDMLETTGCGYRDSKITYFKMDGSNLQFVDKTFDVCLSIAVLEHAKIPLQVITEMKRVTKKGGYCYIQAGPLYYSPFGHHMFGLYDDYPWIHLRMSKDEIIDYSIKNGIDKKIFETRKINVKDYVYSMLSEEHINGLKFEEYRLADLKKMQDIDILHFSQSYEGENLLTNDVLKELKDFRKDDLIGHGFELLFKVI